MPVILTKKFHFEAAHFIPAFPKGHKCRNMHGHSFVVEIKVQGEVDPKTGILIDFARVKEVVKPYIDLMDHSCLNDLGEKENNPYLKNPTSENICIWLYKAIKPLLPGVSSIKIHETCTSACEYFE